MYELHLSDSQPTKSTVQKIMDSFTKLSTDDIKETGWHRLHIGVQLYGYPGRKATLYS